VSTRQIARRGLDDVWLGKVLLAGNLYRESKACLDVLRHSSTQQETTAVLVEAERRHSEALKQYVKVLRVFQELVVEGKVPPDEDVD